ncbi:hypothetical protein GF327_01380 [Candidatus Woesearchaeota archaeon]|nr:hypothetical protein [Candidatus Woesearchaeota archaeon]
MAEMLVVKSKIRDVASDCNVGGDVADKLSEIAVGIVRKAAKRAKANGRKTVQARDVFIGELVSEPMLVVKSKIRDVVTDMNVGGDLPEALNSMLVWTLDQGCKRADANGRKTIQARDL